jgi:dihydrofolate synthase/folylpolyglutamate synthase
MDLMGDPQHAYPVIHITGTNGKGSVARMVTALLVARGLRVGTYTSPHLERVNERMAWNGEPIPDEDLAEVIGAVAELETLLESPPTHFEILTAAAFRWFADVAVDVAVIEVGLGGRWDATNVADAQVAVLTNVSLDHAETIGPGLTDIATE